MATMEPSAWVSVVKGGWAGAPGGGRFIMPPGAGPDGGWAAGALAPGGGAPDPPPGGGIAPMSFDRSSGGAAACPSGIMFVSIRLFVVLFVVFLDGIPHVLG